MNRASVQQSINTRPWITVNTAKKEGDLDSGKEYIMKYLFNKSRYSYNIMVYDGNALRCEEINDVEEFEKKSKVCVFLLFRDTLREEIIAEEVTAELKIAN